MTCKPEPSLAELRAHISRRDPAIISRALAKTWDDPYAERADTEDVKP